MDNGEGNTPPFPSFLV